MNTKTIVCAGAAVVALGLVGCGSETTGSDTTTEATSTSSATETSTSTGAVPPVTSAPAPPAAAGGLTITDYLNAEGITETPVSPGDPSAPTIEFPIPELWEQADNVPGNPFWAIVMTQPSNPAGPPPMIEARLSKLSADVPIGTIFEYAPGELKNLPGYEAMGDGGRDSLGGLEAHQMGGYFDDNGTKSLVAQKTLLIPADDGPFLLRVRATGPEADAPALIAATAQLDDNAVITP